LGDRADPKNHLDGFDLLPPNDGPSKTSPRKTFVYLSDDGDELGLHCDNWKVVFMEQRCTGTLQVWGEPLSRLPLPKLFNLRTDPYEGADITRYDWFIHRGSILYRAWTVMAMWAGTFKESRRFNVPTVSRSTKR
jgi:hypothetical protein